MTAHEETINMFAKTTRNIQQVNRTSILLGTKAIISMQGFTWENILKNAQSMSEVPLCREFRKTCSKNQHRVELIRLKASDCLPSVYTSHRKVVILTFNVHFENGYFENKPMPWTSSKAVIPKDHMSALQRQKEHLQHQEHLITTRKLFYHFHNIIIFYYSSVSRHVVKQIWWLKIRPNRRIIWLPNLLRIKSMNSLYHLRSNPGKSN